MRSIHLRRAGRPAVGALLAFGLSLSSAVLAGTSDATPQRLRSAPLASTDLPTARLVIKYRSGVVATTAADRAMVHRSAQDVASRAGRQLQWLRTAALGVHVMALDQPLPIAEVRRLANDIAASDPSVLYAEPDRIWKPQFVPNDTQYGQQWQYFEPTAGINLPSAWDKSTGAGVVVGVVDTGYRPHADLAANILPGYDFIGAAPMANDGDGRDNDPRDPGDAAAAGECPDGSPAADEPSSWHGTHVAGTIAAVTNNGRGVAGVAFNSKVVPVRVLGKCGGYMSDVADGIIWASGGAVAGAPANANPARVINVSLGGGGECDNTTQAAIDSARSRRTVVVAASGNSNDNVANFTPANCKGVIAVTAVDRRGDRAYYANLGALVALAGPGGDLRSSAANGILSTLNAGANAPGADNYAYYQGTSMAAPHVTGVVALMLSRNPSLSPDDVLSRLKASARPFAGVCPLCGAGLVDANAAVDAAAAGAPPLTPSVVAEAEPNDSLANAQSVALGASIQGTISGRSDTDIYKVSVPGGARMTAQLTPNSSSDYDLYVYDSSAQLIASSDLGQGQLDEVSIQNTDASPVTYYVRVYYYRGGTGSTDGLYKLTIQ